MRRVACTASKLQYDNSLGPVSADESKSQQSSEPALAYTYDIAILPMQLLIVLVLLSLVSYVNTAKLGQFVQEWTGILCERMKRRDTVNQGKQGQ